MLVSVKSLLQIAFYASVIGALVVININQLNSTRAQESGPISGPITSPATPSPEPNNNPPSENHNGDGNNGPSVCGDQLPGTPVLLSAIKTGPNQVKLNWSKPVGPVTGYVLAYGLNPAKMLYGNPNIGNTTSYVVNQLQPRTTYFFQVSAANGCAGGSFSNTVGISANGKVLGSKVATNFKTGVFAAVKPKVSPSVAPKTNTSMPQQTEAPVVSNQTPAVTEKKADLTPKILDEIFYRVIRFFYR